MPQDWISLLSVGTNLSVLFVGIKLVRHLTKIEIKVEMMWSVFMKRFGGELEKENNT